MDQNVQEFDREHHEYMEFDEKNFELGQMKKETEAI